MNRHDRINRYKKIKKRNKIKQWIKNNCLYYHNVNKGDIKQNKCFKKSFQVLTWNEKQCPLRKPLTGRVKWLTSLDKTVTFKHVRWLTPQLTRLMNKKIKMMNFLMESLNNLLLRIRDSKMLSLQILQRMKKVTSMNNKNSLVIKWHWCLLNRKRLAW